MAKSVIRTFIFGDFEREEFKKFIRMGIIFSLIIGSYWIMRALKNSIFCKLVGPHLLPWGKTASILFLFPVVMIYTKLLDRYSREKMLYLIPAFYGVASLIFSALIMFFAGAPDLATQTGLAKLGTQVLAFSWYVFVESYGSLVVALFWAFATELTMPESAKKGFPLVVAIGQVMAIVGPLVLLKLPKLLHLATDALPVALSGMFTLGVIWAVRNFLTSTPKEYLVSYGGAAADKHEEEPGFFEGLRLMVKHAYLFGIFFSIFAYEFIVTVFDFNFQTAAFLHYGNTPEYTEYIGLYAGSVNLVTLICLLLGVSNITRLLGVGVALAMMPLIVGGALMGFITLDSLNFLFALMVGSKAINYALNGPAMKQLYIPTSHDARFKAQAWIETFGSRLSKEGGSIFNMLLEVFQKASGELAGRARYLAWSSYLGAGMIAVWFFIALFLGKTHKRAVQENKIVC